MKCKESARKVSYERLVIKFELRVAKRKTKKLLAKWKTPLETRSFIN